MKGLGETLVGAYPGRALSFICKKNDLNSPQVSKPSSSSLTAEKGLGICPPSPILLVPAFGCFSAIESHRNLEWRRDSLRSNSWTCNETLIQRKLGIEDLSSVLDHSIYCFYGHVTSTYGYGPRGNCLLSCYFSDPNFQVIWFHLFKTFFTLTIC